MSLLDTIFGTNDSHLLIAPIGLGKTSFVFHLLSKEKKIIFIAPLRSIVEEVLEKADTFSINDYEEFCLAKKGILVATPESLLSFDLEYFSMRNILFVLDEFHLYYEWADTFRDSMRDFLEELYAFEARILGLTATMGNIHFKKLKIDMALIQREMQIIDLGNMDFHYPPECSKAMTYTQLNYEMIKLGLISRKKVIVFVRTRKEVTIFVDRLKKYGVDVIGCVGGESSLFLKAYRQRSYQFIVCTKVLGHGVNLGRIDRVLILDEVPSYEKVQMCGRGGRDANSYKVFYLNNSISMNLRSKIKELFSNFALKVLEFLYE